MLKCFSTDFSTYTYMPVNHIIFDNKPVTHCYDAPIGKVSEIRNMCFFWLKRGFMPSYDTYSQFNVRRK